MYKNITRVAYFIHKGDSSNRSIELVTQKTSNSDIFKKKSYLCGNNTDYKNGSIKIYENNDILIPINENEKILFKSMDDTNYNIDETDNCRIYIDTMRKAKPLQV